MTRDLGAGTAEVHQTGIQAQAMSVLYFWLEAVPAEKRFAKDDALDAEITDRFAALRAAVVASEAAGWRDTPAATLAAIILIDQFSRNIFRGGAAAFAADPLARVLATHALAESWDQRLSMAERQFLYMPFMHSEDAADQARSVALFATVDEASADYARQHADQIARFGRFPGRNAALGRINTHAEEALLSQPGAGF